MKRAAICISGHMRQFKDGFKNIQEKIVLLNNEYKFDFFIHTWQTLNWHTDDAHMQTYNVIDDIRNLFNPKIFIIEKNIQWDTTKYLKFIKDPSWVKKTCTGKRTKGEHILGMYYKIFKCNEIKSQHEHNNNFSYDVVIRTRSDFALGNGIKLSDFNDIDNTIYLARCGKKLNRLEIPIRDVFAISTSSNIDFYSSLYENMDDVVLKHKIFRPEPLLHCHLKSRHDLNLKDIDVSWGLFRNNNPQYDIIA